MDVKLIRLLPELLISPGGAKKEVELLASRKVHATDLAIALDRTLDAFDWTGVSQRLLHRRLNQ